MPPTLDLSQASHHKMMVMPPRINLRRATSYEKAPKSSTSSRFNFNHLSFASPPPSPGLPRLVPRPRKTSNTPRPSRVLRVAVWILGLVILIYVASSGTRTAVSAVPGLVWSSRTHEQYEMVGQDDLPEFPTPIMVTDRGGKAKWTVSIPSSAGFPLLPTQYKDLCSKCQEVATRVHRLHHGSGSPNRYQRDQHYVDVHDAEDAGYLSGSVTLGALASQHYQGYMLGEDRVTLMEMPLCKSTMTFVMASTEAGIGRTLMLLWMAYSVAEKEGRSFFIDDSNWVYGAYMDIFDAPPTQKCRPPLRHALVPCPRQANHLVVTADTAEDVLVFTSGHDRASLEAKREIFEHARNGYKMLYRLAPDDAGYFISRRKALKVTVQAAGAEKGMVVGMHVRRGDCHPREYEYHRSYMPMEIYAETARRRVVAAFSSREPELDAAAQRNSLYLLASDDPLVYEAEEFSNATRAQEQIKLAGKAHIKSAAENVQRGAMHKFVDDAFGWDGGFFGAMFWNLGLTAHGAADAAASPDSRPAPPAQVTQLRNYLARAYMLDLAVLAGTSDVVVCTASSMGCQLLAVMLGWEASFEEHRWVNIDGGSTWSGP